MRICVFRDTEKQDLGGRQLIARQINEEAVVAHGKPGAESLISEVPGVDLIARPPADYMAPHCDGVTIPLEDARIIWQR